jgi:ribosomal protein L37AE/L43A
MIQCPNCDRDAQDRTPKDFDGEVVVCQSCGYYEIAGGSEANFRNLEPQDRRQVFEKAKRFSTTGRICISSTCF